MLNVITLEEALALVEREFVPAAVAERTPLMKALGRTLAEDMTASEFVPDFDRSTVDGYALRARDTFGCSDAIPAILMQQAEVRMGEGADFVLQAGCCAAVPPAARCPGARTAWPCSNTRRTMGTGPWASPGPWPPERI